MAAEVPARKNVNGVEAFLGTLQGAYFYFEAEVPHLKRVEFEIRHANVYVLSVLWCIQQALFLLRKASPQALVSKLTPTCISWFSGLAAVRRNRYERSVFGRASWIKTRYCATWLYGNDWRYPMEPI